MECTGLQREKAVLEKDKKRLGQQVETKAVLLDEVTETAAERQRQNKALRKAVGRTEDCTGRLKDMEQENVTLRQQASTERKTVATLREVRVSVLCGFINPRRNPDVLPYQECTSEHKVKTIYCHVASTWNSHVIAYIEFW